MLQKELAKRLKARYDTKMDGSGWLEVSSDGIPLCRIKYNGQFLSNADKNLSDEYRSKIADIQDEISTVREYVSDCISKRIKANNGERNKYYIENNHPAIIDAGTFARVQEEIARRSGKPKVKQKGTKTELSRYSSKYALSELLICGECRTPYRRCTWTAKGKRKIVWRCCGG